MRVAQFLYFIDGSTKLGYVTLHYIETLIRIRFLFNFGIIKPEYNSGWLLLLSVTVTVPLN